jgi:hypothetical protein
VRVLDPGHFYLLHELDKPRDEQNLVFVKRNEPQEKFPGNVGRYPGTTLQEVLRACIDRLKYVNKQQPDARNFVVIQHLRMAIWLLEIRAAIKHKRVLKCLPVEIELKPTCPSCGHIECEEAHQ